jgi:hypothetical protein
MRFRISESRFGPGKGEDQSRPIADKFNSNHVKHGNGDAAPMLNLNTLFIFDNEICPSRDRQSEKKNDNVRPISHVWPSLF